MSRSPWKGILYLYVPHIHIYIWLMLHIFYYRKDASEAGVFPLKKKYLIMPFSSLLATLLGRNANISACFMCMSMLVWYVEVVIKKRIPYEEYCKQWKRNANISCFTCMFILFWCVSGYKGSIPYVE